MKKNKSDKVWKQKSLESLENNRWPDEKEFPTGLIERCHKYRKIPIGELTIEQLRTLIGQNIGLKYLVPTAIEYLTKDILTEGDFYPGDLLESVLKIETAFWTQNSSLKEQLVNLVNLNLDKISSESLDLGNLENLQ